MMTELDKINTIGVWLGSDTRQARSAVDFMNGLLDEIQKLQSELEKVRELLDRSYDAVKHTTKDRSLLDDLDEFLKTKN